MAQVSSTATGSEGPPTPARRSRAGAEAARYGVLRRLGPVLKHDMVVHLQAIAMMAEVLNARLERGTPDPAQLQSSAQKLNRMAREAVASSLKVASWLEPGEDETTRLSDGVEECLSLLASNFNFRGFTVAREVPESNFQVSRTALRNLLVASLITLTDAAGGPCEVHVRAQAQAGVAEITVRIHPRNDEVDAAPYEPPYRHLEWADVQALAAAEGVELIRGADHIVMRVPRALPTTPLQIAPH